MRSLAYILEEYQFLNADERYRLLIQLGRELQACPPLRRRPQRNLYPAYL
jgi:sulfur transfer protein SufE